MNTEQYRLLERLLEGTCTGLELETVKKLLDTEEGKIALSEIMEIKDSLAEKRNSIEDKEDLKEKVQAWKHEVHRRIAATEMNKNKRQRKWLPAISRAAIWIGIVFTIGLIAHQASRKESYHSQVNYVKRINEVGSPIRHVLPDSSEIYLGAGSYVVYPEQFSDAERLVRLVGQAFFEVKRDEQRPFVIESGEIQTRVLGTSFRITAFEGEPIEVAVSTGKVSVNTGKNKSNHQLSVLTAGQKINYDYKNHRIEQGDIIALDDFEQWKTGELIFEDKPLGLVALELQRKYGVEVICLDKETFDYRVTGSFASGESIEQILKLLSTMGKLKYTKKNKSIYEVYKME